jgi:hypothetical protein
MPIRGSPNGARHPRPQAGRDRPEWVVAINRNAWSQSIGTAGRDHPVRASNPNHVVLSMAKAVRKSTSAGDLTRRSVVMNVLVGSAATLAAIPAASAYGNMTALHPHPDAGLFDLEKQFESAVRQADGIA